MTSNINQLLEMMLSAISTLFLVLSLAVTDLK